MRYGLIGLNTQFIRQVISRATPPSLGTAETSHAASVIVSSQDCWVCASMDRSTSLTPHGSHWRTCNIRSLTRCQRFFSFSLPSTQSSETADFAIPTTDDSPNPCKDAGSCELQPKHFPNSNLHARYTNLLFSYRRVLESVLRRSLAHVPFPTAITPLRRVRGMKSTLPQKP